MNAFEITEWDVVAAVNEATGKSIDPDEAFKFAYLFDSKKVDNAAAFSSEGDPGSDENDDDMNAATDRAIAEMTRQITADPDKFAPLIEKAF